MHRVALMGSSTAKIISDIRISAGSRASTYPPPGPRTPAAAAAPRALSPMMPFAAGWHANGCHPRPGGPSQVHPSAQRDRVETMAKLTQQQTPKIMCMQYLWSIFWTITHLTCLIIGWMASEHIITSAFDLTLLYSATTYAGAQILFLEAQRARATLVLLGHQHA